MRQRTDQNGFTLVEVLAVVAVVAVLLGTAMSTFTGSRRRADDAAAEETAALAVRTVKAAAEPEPTMPGTAKLATEEANISFVVATTASNSVRVVSTGPAAAPRPEGSFVVAVRSTSGRCFFRLEVPGEPEQRAEVDTPPAGCTAAGHTAVPGSAWTRDPSRR